MFATTLRYACVLLTLSFPAFAHGQEYFGKFLDALRGIFVVEAKPRPVFKLEREFRFDDPNGLMWSTPAGTEVDGASIPQVFWSIIGGPFEGPYINASVIHDYYCRTKLRTAHDTHRNFYYGMRASDVPEWKATFMHWAVAAFGPDWKLQPRITMRQTCTQPAGLPPTCTIVPDVEIAMVDAAPVDLSDPEVLAAAISKATAVARTLRTSNGKVLDVTATGPVAATADNIRLSSRSYRQVFLSKEFLSSPSRLGLLSQTSSAGLSDIQPWSGNRVPTLSEAIVLTPQTLRLMEGNKPFKLDPRSKDLVRDRLDLKALEATVQMHYGVR